MTRAVEVCPCCGTFVGDYWTLPAGWFLAAVPALPAMTPDELVQYLTERRLLERDEAFAKEHADGC